MKLTLSVIKADVGSIGGHNRLHSAESRFAFAFAMRELTSRLVRFGSN